MHVSTDEVFGSLGADGLFTERTAYAPNSPYSASKAGSDHLVRAWHHTYGLPTMVTNCSNNYGPYQFPEKVIPLFVTNLIDGAQVPLYGDGLNVRDWLHVDDHCRGIAITVAKGGQSLGIGAGQMNRVGSARIALETAGDKARGAVLASDGFFPFEDTVRLAAGFGISAVIQPGGSMRDDEVIAAADERGLAMVYTGHRHFRH